MPLKGGQVRGALQMLALFPARSAQVVPAPFVPAGKGRHSTRTKNSYSELLHGLRRHFHNLKGGSVRAQPPPRSPTHAHTHLTLTHGPAAPDAVDIFAFALLRVQVLVGDDYRPGACFSSLFAVSVRAGCSR